jgi:hypothetical protein
MEQAYSRVIHIAKDFSYVAQTYGRIIITERFLTREEKTVKPIDIGGRAGGVKYVVHGVLFKVRGFAQQTDSFSRLHQFAIDENNMFRGSDAAAHKVAGHELRGLTNYFNNCQDICFPLMALLDYVIYSWFLCCSCSHHLSRKVNGWPPPQHLTRPESNRRLDEIHMLMFIKPSCLRSQITTLLPCSCSPTTSQSPIR